MAIAHAFGLARHLDLNSTAEAFTLVCCHHAHLNVCSPGLCCARSATAGFIPGAGAIGRQPQRLIKRGRFEQRDVGAIPARRPLFLSCRLLDPPVMSGALAARNHQDHATANGATQEYQCHCPIVLVHDCIGDCQTSSKLPASPAQTRSDSQCRPLDAPSHRKSAGRYDNRLGGASADRGRRYKKQSRSGFSGVVNTMARLMRLPPHLPRACSSAAKAS
jgi:hypothetical protein